MEEAEAAAVELAVAANEQWRLAVAKADALSNEQWRLWVAKADAELAEAFAAADEQRRLWVAKAEAELAEAFAAADEQRRLWVAKAEAEFAEAAAKADTLAVEVVVAAMQQQRQQRPVRSSGSGGSSGRVAHKKAVYDRAGYTMGCVLFTTLIVFFYVLNLLCAANIARITLGREEGIEGSSSTLIHDLNFLQIRHLNREGGLGLDKRAKPWVEVLSWEPRAFLYHNFLSLEETNYLRELYHSSPIEFKFARRNSYLRGPLEFSGVYTASIERGQYKVIRDIEKRMADFMHIPPEHGEGLEMTIIRSGNTYYPHLDYFSNESDVRNGGGQRIATMIIFLNDVETGGEAIFPAAKGNFSSLPGRDQLSECGKEAGLAVKPKEGDAVFFWNVRPDGMPDPSSLHGHCLSSEESMIGVKRFRAHEHKI